MLTYTTKPVNLPAIVPQKAQGVQTTHPRFSLSLFRGNNDRKHYTVVDGKLENTGGNEITRGVIVPKIGITLQDLHRHLLDDWNYLSGIPIDGDYSERPLVTEKNLRNGSRAIARSLKCLAMDFSSGYIPVVIDIDSTPEHPREELEAALYRVLPQLANTTRLVTHSSSAGIFKDGQLAKKKDGRHIVFLVRCGSQVEADEFKANLRRRTWLEGSARFDLSTPNKATGRSAALERSCIDFATFQPAQPIFERSAFLSPEAVAAGFYQDRPQPELIEGSLLYIDAEDFRLTPEQIELADQLKAEAKALVTGLQTKEQKKNLIASGVSKQDAKRIIKQSVQAEEGGCLEPDFLLYPADGSTPIKAGDLTAQHDGLLLKSVLEPDYRGGAQTAKVWLSKAGSLTITDLAHGTCKKFTVGKGFKPSGVKVAPKSKGQLKREFRAMSAQKCEKLLKNPFSRPYDVICRTVEEYERAVKDHPFCFVDGPTGAGKTQGLRFLTHEEVNIGQLNPLRSLARANGAALGLPFFNENRGDHDGSFAACIHSIIPIENELTRRVKGRNLSLYPDNVIIIDEVEQCLEQLLAGELCEDNRAQRIAAFRRILGSAGRVIAASATSAQYHLDYLEAVTGRRFTLIRFDPKIHRKGRFTIYSGNGQPGSDRAAKGTVQALAILPRTYLATDSESQAINFNLGSPDSFLLTKRTVSEDPLALGLIQSDSPGETWGGMAQSLLIASPIVQSGWSLRGDHFDRVVVFATGKTIAPSNVLQQADRYRSSVDRFAYAPRFSAPPAGISRPGKHWKNGAEKLQKGVASSDAWRDFEFLGGAELSWLEKHEELRQITFSNFALALSIYAERQGYEVYWGSPDDSEFIYRKDEVERLKADPIVSAKRISPEEFQAIITKPEPSQREQDQLEAFLIRDYWGKGHSEDLSHEEVIDEQWGKGRKALKAMLRILWDGQAEAEDQKVRERVGDSGYLWDCTNYQLSLEWWDQLGIDALLYRCCTEGYSFRSDFIKEFSERLAQRQEELGDGSRLLGVKIPWHSPYGDLDEYLKAIVKWVGMMLKRLGLETESTRLNEDGERFRVYRVTSESLEKMNLLLSNKTERQTAKGFTLRATPFIRIFQQGVALNSPGQIQAAFDGALVAENVPLIAILGDLLDSATT